MLTKRDLLRSAALVAITASTAKSIPAYAQTSTDRPSFFKAKDIAEAGFIYGLPIVMNYGVMYEYAIDRNSGQFKAPFNQIKNEPNVFTYKDKAIPTPNSDTPYSFLVWGVFCQGVRRAANLLSFVSFFVRSQSPFLRPDPRLVDVVARRSCQGWPSRQPCGML